MNNAISAGSPSHPGYCPCCRRETTFTVHNEWLRDHYLCDRCASIPRQRHLLTVLDRNFPQWERRTIHESSPSNALIGNLCRGYSCSQYLPERELGSVEKGIRCENIEALTYRDNTFDLFITQDVLEHVFHPDKALKEIQRVLKPGGAHVFTAPKHKTLVATRCRAALREDGSVENLLEAQYHGNPVGDGRALVTWDYGYDFELLMSDWTGEPVATYNTRDKRLGIEAEFNEIFVIRKP